MARKRRSLSSRETWGALCLAATDLNSVIAGFLGVPDLAGPCSPARASCAVLAILIRPYITQKRALLFLSRYVSSRPRGRQPSILSTGLLGGAGLGSRRFARATIVSIATHPQSSLRNSNEL